MRRFTVLLFLLCALTGKVSAEETDEVFYNLPNSGINLEGLSSNPANGAACVQDFNEDGYPDILVTGSTYNDMTRAYTNLLINNAGKSFTRYDLGMQPVSYGSIAAVKVATKKWLIAVQGCTQTDAAQSAAVTYTFSLSCERIIPRASLKTDIPNGAYSGQIHFIDFNGDSKADIVQFGTGRIIHAYIGDGTNAFTETDITATGLKSFAAGDTKVADMDGDGAKDIATVSIAGLITYHNNQDGTFTATRSNTSFKWNGTPKLDIADIDKDGYNDVVAFSNNSTTGSYNVVFYWGSATGLVEDANINNLIGVAQAAVAIGDFNKDGNLDVAYSGTNDRVRQGDAVVVNCQKAYILLGDGNRHFTQHVKWNTERNCPDVFTLGAVREGTYFSVDFDGDGYNDIYAIGYLGLWMGGKNMRYADLYYSGNKYGWGQPIKDFAVKHKWEGFPFNEVRLSDGRLKQAQDKEIRYLKSLDINRLYASTLDYNLGIKGNVPYGGWEESGYGASFAHWTSGLALGYAATGDAELLSLLKQSVDIMIKSQAFNGDGFFAFKDGTTWGFDKMAKYKIIEPYGWDENGHPWGNNDIGFPLYAHHKILAALRDGYVYGGLEESRIAFLKFCDWFCMWVQNFDQENMQKILESEHGGMVEVLSDAYALSGNAKYLDCAQKFTRNNFASTIGSNIDDLAGRHSNFHVPMAVGAAVNYHYTGNTTNGNIGRNFLNMIKDHHSLANGGHGNQERIGLPDNQTYQLGLRGPETCSSYNMLKLAKELFMQEGRVDYLDYFENVTYNHILASFSMTEGEGPTYHCSLKPGTFKCYDNLYNNFWCCTGSTMEVQMKYVDGIYFNNGTDLLVNLFTPSKLDWREKGMKMTMQTTYPSSSNVVLTISENASFDGDICFRYPTWASKGSMRILINNVEQTVQGEPGTIVHVSNSWKAGDVITMVMPAEFRLVDMPDDVNVSAVFYGPLMMGATLGSPSQNYVGVMTPADAITNPVPEPYFPAINHSRSNLGSLFTAKDISTLKFTTNGLNTNYSFRPFCDINDQRYNVYWKIGDAEDIAFEKTVVTDHVITGDAKSEADHNLKSYNSGSGYAAFGFWGPTYFYYRDAYDGGYLQYDLDLAAGENTVNDRYYLQVIYFGSEPTGFGNFKIYVDGTVVAPVGSISYLAPLDHKVLYYPRNTTLTQGKNKVTVKFADGRLSLYGIKIMKAGNIIVALKKLGLPVATKIELPTADSSDNKIQNNYKGIYNILGQKLDKTQEGINIIDGEKIFLTK